MVTTAIAYQATNTSATAGTSTTLNQGNDIITPEPSREIVNMTIWGVPSAAITAAQMLEERITLTSNDIDLQPKQISYLISGSGLGASFATMSPMLQSWPMHIPTEGGDNITAQGTPYDTTTVPTSVGLMMMYMTGRSGKRQVFWADPGAQTSTGTTAALTVGSTYRINNVSDLAYATGYMALNVVTLSDSVGGEMTLVSSDYNTSLPLSYPVQPAVVGLSTIIGVIFPKQALNAINIPTRENVAITEQFRHVVSQAAAGDFISGVGYHRRGR